MELLVVDDVIEEATRLIVGELRDATRHGRIASIALSGGRNQSAILEQLAMADLAWDRVHIYQVDERIVPFCNPARNLTHLYTALLSHVPAVAHPLPVDDPDLDVAMSRYAADLPPVFDLVHLGLGADGHTASLVPGDAALDVTDRDVAVTNKYQGARRVTLTFAPLDRAKRILWIVSGEGKREVLHRLIDGDPTIPAGRVARDRAVVVTDINHRSADQRTEQT